MNLKSKVFEITDEKGNEINLEGKEVKIFLNGEVQNAKLEEIFTHLELDDGEIYGNSLLSYYKVEEDGTLSVGGSVIRLIVDDATVFIKSINRPQGVNDDEPIPFEHIKKFVEFFKIEKPHEVFVDLNADEKQIFIKEGTVKTTADKVIADKVIADKVIADKVIADKVIADKAITDKAAADKLAAEKKLKESIDPKQIQEQKDYLATQSFYAGLDGFKEYIKEKFHLFYGSDLEQAPCMLIKRGEAWWEECTLMEVIDKSEKQVIINFNDGKDTANATLDLEAEQLIINQGKDKE